MEKEFLLTSGNRLRVTHLKTPERGGMTGYFRDRATPDDIAEAAQIMRAEVPEDGQITMVGTGSREAVGHALSEHLAEGLPVN